MAQNDTAVPEGGDPPMVVEPSAEPPAAVAAQDTAVQGPSSDVKVFAPSDTAQTPIEPDDAFFEPTVSDAQALQAMIAGRSKQLNDAPLLTSKHRDAEKAARDQKRADKWPSTTIRVKFSDGTQIQSTFPSTSPIQPVYAFVRSSLNPEAQSKSFTLCQPPRTMYPEKPIPQPPTKKHPNPAMKGKVITPANYGPVRGGPAAGLTGGTGGKETLFELGLVPQSVLVVKWDDVEMNASSFQAPLTADLLAQAAPLPPPQPKDTPSSSVPAAKKLTADKMPKWLQKGLMKKKT